MAARLSTSQKTTLAQSNMMQQAQRACRPSRLAFQQHSTRSSAKKSAVIAAASEESRESTSSLDEESRLEALERGVRKRQGESAQSISVHVEKPQHWEVSLQ